MIGMYIVTWAFFVLATWWGVAVILELKRMRRNIYSSTEVFRFILGADQIQAILRVVASEASGMVVTFDNTGKPHFEKASEVL